MWAPSQATQAQAHTHPSTHLEVGVECGPLGGGGLPNLPKGGASLLGRVGGGDGGEDLAIEVVVPFKCGIDVGLGVDCVVVVGAFIGEDKACGLVEVGGNPLEGAFLGALGHMEAKELGHHLRKHHKVHGGHHVKPLVGKAHKLPHCPHPCVKGWVRDGLHVVLGLSLVGVVVWGGLGEWWVEEEGRHCLLLFGVGGVGLQHMGSHIGERVVGIKLGWVEWALNVATWDGGVGGVLLPRGKRLHLLHILPHGGRWGSAHCMVGGLHIKGEGHVVLVCANSIVHPHHHVGREVYEPSNASSMCVAPLPKPTT